MTTKTDTVGTKVDWNYVNKVTEIARTYLVTDQSGKEFFKMYKPSEAQKIFDANGWKGQIVGVINRRRNH